MAKSKSHGHGAFSIRKILQKIWTGVVYVWNRPLIVSLVLLVPAVLLFLQIIHQAFAKYMNCHYLIVTRLGLDTVFCNGVDLVFFSIPGLKSFIDPPLELARKLIAWTVVLFLGFTSLFLTMIIQRLKTIVKLLTFDKQAWREFLGGFAIWLLLFVGFSAAFYFAVVRR